MNNSYDERLISVEMWIAIIDLVILCTLSEQYIIFHFIPLGWIAFHTINHIPQHCLIFKLKVISLNKMALSFMGRFAILLHISAEDNICNGIKSAKAFRIIS